MDQPYYTTAALADLEHILTNIAEDKIGAALTWVEKLEAKCLLIASTPEMGELQPNLGEMVHSNVVGRYVIFHRNVNDQVEILRILTGDRNIMDLR